MCNIAYSYTFIVIVYVQVFVHTTIYNRELYKLITQIESALPIRLHESLLIFYFIKTLFSEHVLSINIIKYFASKI